MADIKPFENLSEEELRNAFVEKVNTFCAFASNHTPRKELLDRHFTSIVVMAEELAKRGFTDNPLSDHLLPTKLLAEIGSDKDDIPGWPHPTYKQLVSVFDMIGYQYKRDGHPEVTEAIDKLQDLMKTPLFESTVVKHFKPVTERAAG